MPWFTAPDYWNCWQDETASKACFTHFARDGNRQLFLDNRLPHNIRQWSSMSFDVEKSNGCLTKLGDPTNKYVWHELMQAASVRNQLRAMWSPNFLHETTTFRPKIQWFSWT